ncbi:putative cation transport protein [Lyophyllum shimeji]|uniref:Cation transport protein n=1 Tax=Lyophyllum shimeji TaxID=47721 RepID=A0A9P3PMI9_LYOSH|nr:putative cation transport protein [Lyophyllum shimeji]
MPATTSLVAQHREAPPGSRSAPYLSFDAIVGRNSTFHRLSHHEMEELGGIEYRALDALLWIIGVYHVGLQLIGFVVIAPYISTPRWHQNFVPPAEMRPQNTVWFSVFQVAAAYCNTGFSLVDKSMVPFQTAYPMVFILAFLILAGNVAFPIFLRFTIWILKKLLPKTSRVNETLQFLLDHPRRCFILLFPSLQTWYLVLISGGLTLSGWFFFMVLDIGNPGTESIPLGVRFVVGFFQNVAVRSAGFAIVTLSVLVAAVKFFFVIMMYISVYPIAMGIRSTNVYEEQSLGIFPAEDMSEAEFEEPTGPRLNVWGRYLAMHARRQLAFDMWWLAAAVFLICIIERHRLNDPSLSSWFNIFTVMFEVVSAYGTIGLSLGTPNNNFSFSGELKTLSKLVLCVVMIRGRHRVLPVAIDRAVMLPSEMQKQLDQEAGTRSQSSVLRSSTRAFEGDSRGTPSDLSSDSPSVSESRSPQSLTFAAGHMTEEIWYDEYITATTSRFEFKLTPCRGLVPITHIMTGSAPGLESSDAIAVAAFDALAALGAAANVAVLATAILSLSVQRRTTWTALIGSFIIYSVALLVTAGWQLESEIPPFGLCFFQTILIHASTLLCILSYTCFAIDCYLLMSTLVSDSSRLESKIRRTRILVTSPWLLSAIVALVDVFLVLQDRSTVQRLPSRFYCYTTMIAPTMINVAATVTAALLVFPLEFYTACLLYKNWHAFRRLSPDSDRPGVSSSLYIRLALFTAIGGIVVMLATSIVPRLGHKAPSGSWSIILPIIPILAALAFGTQKDIMNAWRFRRTKRATEFALTPTSPLRQQVEEDEA